MQTKMIFPFIKILDWFNDCILHLFHLLPRHAGFLPPNHMMRHFSSATASAFFDFWIAFVP